MECCTECGIEFKNGDVVLMTIVLNVEDGQFVPWETLGKFHKDCLDT